MHAPSRNLDLLSAAQAAESALAAAERLFAAGDVANAGRALLAIVREGVQPPALAARAYNDLAVVAFTIGDLDAARESAQRALAEDASHAAAYETLGRCAQSAGNWAEAARCFELGARLAPADPGFGEALAEVRAAQYAATVANLKLLNDVLADSPLAGRWWVWAGLLLGWAREGRMMDHDATDVDFAFYAGDEDRLLASIPALRAAGFEPLLRFPAARGPATEYTFARDGAKFEFFKFEPAGERKRYWSYGFAGGQALANECELPAQPLTEFAFLGRTWLKPLDHDLELTANYGDWRTPDPGWQYMDGPSIVARRQWDPSGVRWTGELPVQPAAIHR